MPSPFISREEKFVTKKPSFARNVSFRVMRNPPACLMKGSFHTTTLMSACVGKVPVFLHRHTCKRTSGCLTATNATQCGKQRRALVSHQGSRALVSCNINFLSKYVTYCGYTLGLQDLVRTDSVLAYQRIRLFVWANSMKTVVFDTYQEIPDTGHF